jgi:hypothetical protein
MVEGPRPGFSGLFPCFSPPPTPYPKSFLQIFIILSKNNYRENYAKHQAKICCLTFFMFSDVWNVNEMQVIFTMRVPNYSLLGQAEQ